MDAIERIIDRKLALLPAPKTICPTCGGTGDIKFGDFRGESTDPFDYLLCSRCEGTGRL